MNIKACYPQGNHRVASILIEDEGVEDSDLMKIHRNLTAIANLLDTTFADEDE